MNQRIEEIAKKMHDGSLQAYSKLRDLEMICMNVEITTAKLGDTSDARALAKTGEIIRERVKMLEEEVNAVKIGSAEIIRLNKEDTCIK